MKKILVVEDDKAIGKALYEKLEKNNLEVFIARDGEEGLSLCEKERPDLILLDILMPKLDGIGMLESLRKNDWGREIPVMILSNFGDSEKVAEAMRNNAFDFMIKSDHTIDEVVSKIKEKLE